MCTCLDIKGINHYFGRTLDLDYHYNEECVITPRGYRLRLSDGTDAITSYAIVGTAMVFEGMPMYYEAVNEKGLCIAGLNFPYNAAFNEREEGRLNLAISDIIPYFLSKYESVGDLRMDLESLNIVDEVVNGMPQPSLHFMISDSIESIVIEQTKQGLNVYENSYGVMTNNPPFNLQIKNLNRYEGLTNAYKEVEDKAYTCVGLGSDGLPGGYSSPDRFVKAAYLARYASFNGDENKNVCDYFHILDSVSMVSNSCLTKANKVDLTYYTSCINVTKGIYYYKTYTNNEIKRIELNDENMNDELLTRFPLDYEYSFKKLN